MSRDRERVSLSFSSGSPPLGQEGVWWWGDFKGLMEESYQIVLSKRLATVEFHMCELAHFLIIAEYSIVFYLLSIRICPLV
jgi:hypothetical protein